MSIHVKVQAGKKQPERTQAGGCWASIHYQSLCQRTEQVLHARERGWYLINIRAAAESSHQRQHPSGKMRSDTHSPMSASCECVSLSPAQTPRATIIIRGDILGWIKSHTYRPQSQRVRAALKCSLLSAQPQTLTTPKKNTGHFINNGPLRNYLNNSKKILN